jgi:hypothetical protein
LLKTKHHSDTAAAIDSYLSANYNFAEHRLQEDGRHYRTWYAKALTTLALMAGEDEVRFAYTNYEYQVPSHIVVFTDRSLFHLTVPDLSSSESPAVRAFARSALIGCEVMGSYRIDAEARQARTWPGETRVHLRYAGLEQTIELVTPGYDQISLSDPDPLIEFLPTLLSDLSSESRA